MKGFRQLGERDIYAWRAFRLVEAELASPDGTTFTRTFLKHPGAVGIVALDRDDVILVRQFRPSLGVEFLEIPAGTLDQEGEDPRDCGHRELAEEVGARAARMEHLITYSVAPGVSSEQMHLYLATGLTFGERNPAGIEEEAMTTERLPLEDAARACRDGRITDAKTIVGILLVTSTT